MVFIYTYTRIEAPQSLALQGLCEVSLHNNEFDDKCIRDMCQFLQFDAWTKSIGLRANNIGMFIVFRITDIEGTRLLSMMLDTNESLISLDLRDNPGFTLPLSKDIFDKLVRNIRFFKEAKLNDEDNEHEVSISKIYILQDPTEQGYIDNQKAMEQLYNQYSNEPIQEVQMEEEDLDEVSVSFSQQRTPVDVDDANANEDLCQKLQSENLRLQYDNVNLQMQLKNYQTNNKDESEEQLRSRTNEPEELIPRIEFLMNELSRMMDTLEQRGENNSFNNVTFFLK